MFGCPPLLAQRSTWENLGNRFSGDHLQFQFSDLIGAASVVVLFAGGFWLLTRLAAWQAAEPTKPCPKRLLAEIGLRHGLSRSDLRLCREVATELSLDRPAEVFIRDEARTALARRDANLAERLFG